MKITKKIISLILLLSVFTTINLRYTSVNSFAKEEKSHKEIALEMAKKQLKEQKADRFLPLIEKEIEEMYGNIGRFKDTTGYFPNGGAVSYVQSYTVPRLTVCKVFFSDEAYEEIINGNPIPDSFSNNIGSVLIGKLGLRESIVWAICSIGNDYNNYNIKEAGGVLKFYAEDANGSTNILLPWWDHPYATYPDDADVEIF